MKTIRRFSILLLFIFLMVCQISFAQTAEELMPKAIQLEEVNGELEEAINVYMTIIEKYPDNKPVAAKAYFHMGLCYEKLGKQEAEKAYTTLIRDYSEQEEMVSAAKTRLYALAHPADPQLAKGMTMRKVWEGPGVDFMGEPSPDGRYISYVDWETGDLAIYEKGTGKKRRLTSNGTWVNPVQFAEFSRWSPDGKNIVFDWYRDDNPAFIDLYIVGLDGKEPLKLWSDQEMTWTRCYDWSPDGKQILVCFSKKDSITFMGMISTSDGSLRILKELSQVKGSKAWPRNIRFSPDSRFIAYDVPAGEARLSRDICLLSTDGKVDTKLVEHPADDYMLGWDPEGRGILFNSDRNGTQSVWITRTSDGEHFGEPELVKQDIGNIEPIGFTREGSYYFGNIQTMKDVYVADLQQATGKAPAPAERAVQTFEGYNEAPAYSPDGKYLAYISGRSRVDKAIYQRVGGNVLCIKSLETDEVREIRPPLHIIGYPAWSPDGTSIALLHWNEYNRAELYRIDVQSGSATPISMPDKYYFHFGGHMWSPSGNTFYYGLRDLTPGQEEKWHLMARELRSGEEKPIYSSGTFYTLSMSPDGRWFVLTCPGKDPHLTLLSADGAESLELCSFREGVNLGGVPSTTWSADGKYILFGMTDPEADPQTFELCRISAGGGEPERLGVKSKSEFLNLDAHPDGRHIAYSSMNQLISEIWVMENIF